jgi:hypothetical protein
MFLQRSDRTGKTFTVKTLISGLELCGEKCLIYSATWISEVYYPGGISLHSLFRIGIDGQFASSFRSNIGHDTLQARRVCAAGLIIIDEISMSAPSVRNPVSMTLQSISGQDRNEFGGKRILFAGHLRQLPSVVRHFSMPVVYKSPAILSLNSKMSTLAADESIEAGVEWLFAFYC